MPSARVGLLVVLAGLWWAPVQGAPAEQGVPPVPLGTWVRVVHWECPPETLPGLGDPAVCPAVRTEGLVIAGDREHLNLRRGTEEFAVSLSSERLLRLEVRRSRWSGPGAARGLKRGALIGLAVGSLALLGCSSDCGESRGELLGMVGTTVGISATTGAAIGLAFGGGRWESVPGRGARPSLSLRISF